MAYGLRLPASVLKLLANVPYCTSCTSGTVRYRYTAGNWLMRVPTGLKSTTRQPEPPNQVSFLVHFRPQSMAVTQCALLKHVKNFSSVISVYGRGRT
jgi:hypothetical protein